MSLSDVCRCCLRDDVRLNSIHREHRLRLGINTINTNILDMLLLITQISIDKEDGLPQLLCIPCTKKVSKAYSFRWQTQQSDIMLRNSLQYQCNADLSEKVHLQDENSEPRDDQSLLNAEVKLSVECDENSHDIANENDTSKPCTNSSNTKCTNIKTNKKRSKLKSKESARRTRLKNCNNIKDRKIKQKSIALKCNEDDEQFSKDLKDELPEDDFECHRKKLTKSIKSDTESILSKADVKEQYFESEIIESIATLNDADSSSFINKYARDIEDAYFSNSIPNVDDQEDQLKTEPQINNDREHWLNDASNESTVQNENKPTKKDKETYGPLYEFPDDPQICSVCSEHFDNVHSLIKHRSEQHPPKKFQCLTCGNGLTTTRGLRLHMRLHTGEKPEVCAICGKAFADPRTLKNHERMHTGQNPFPCSVCDKRFPSRLSLSLHLRSHTGERPYQCPQCKKSYVQANSLQIHMRTHTGVRPYPCKMCNKAFTNSSSLSVHMLTHSGVKNYQCTICGKRMARSGELTIHLRTHSGERPFTCNICHKAFTNSSALRTHMPTHTGVKNFVCTMCGKRVARAVELRIHMRTHTGERRYHCPQCDQSFTTSSNMRLHQRKHTGEKPFSCKVCDRRFADSHVLRNHMRTHTGEKPFTCDTCGHAFAQQASLRTHLNTHHKAVKNEAASIEGKKLWKPTTKESQTYSDMMQLNVKPTEFINNMDETSLSKILSSAVVDRNGALSLQECLSIDMADSANNQTVNLVESFNTLPLMNIIPRDPDNYISNCSPTTMS